MTDQFRIVPTLYDSQGRPYCAATNSVSANHTRAKCILPPNKVIPVIFVPGIMGSNLRSANGGEVDVVWRPDDLGWVRRAQGFLPARRQQIYDKDRARVDVRAPVNESVLYRLTGFDAKQIGNNWRQEFVRRGWGTVMQGSYATLLCMMEYHLNHIYNNRRLASFWEQLISNQGGAAWGVLRGFQRLTQEELSSASEYWYPVHAVGYNWLQSNSHAGRYLAGMMEYYMNHYRGLGYHCEKCILVTHSMGGLVARAAMHPQLGNAADKVLGVVHGVQPITGAPAAYKRVRAGNEASGLVSFVTARLLGWSASEVTPVFAQSPGPLELLPNKAYPKGWLSVSRPDWQAGWRDQVVVQSLPNSDPYAEIYRERHSWWRLVDEALIDPAREAQAPRTPWGIFLNNLALAEDFHNRLGDYFHSETWLHYGADPRQRAWGRVQWRWSTPGIGSRSGVTDEDVRESILISDNRVGRVRVRREPQKSQPISWSHSIMPPEAEGDATVPHQSGGAAPSSVKFVARMRGFEHQQSFDDRNVQAVTMYSIAKIVGRMGS